MNTTGQDLPVLTDEQVERLESGVFSDIARQRASERESARKRRRWITGSLTAAAVVAVVAISTPLAMQGMLTGGSDASDTASAGYDGGPGDGASMPEMAGIDEPAMIEAEAMEDSAASRDATDIATDRRVIRNGYVSIVVGDVLAASEELTALAAEHNGYVEAMGSSSDRYDELAAATDIRSGWATLRIPAESLDEVRSALGDIGSVTSTEISETDVTDQAIDLEARIDATRASVDRLTELMEQAGSVADLLAAEQALSERQGQLESYQRQLDGLENQVAMSTLHVDLTREREVASTDPAGFSDGLLSGWNGLIGFANGVVIAAGFVLPWVGAIGVAGLIVWVIVRIVRRGRASQDATSRAE
ncbi:DUF4349 domain-containing protein [Microbacterium amylolyticum]|nr:DUF4349 domain-containing protein [Microbacterium amylolyticum]